MERRANIRLSKSLDCTISIDRKEYDAHILDISKEGMAFSINVEADIREGDLVVISMQDEYEKDGQKKVFMDDLIGYVKDVNRMEEYLNRCGCYIKDRKYSEYVQEQLIMNVCEPLMA